MDKSAGSRVDDAVVANGAGQPSAGKPDLKVLTRMEAKAKLKEWPETKHVCGLERFGLLDVTCSKLMEVGR